jgi:hypothetical protein
VPTLFVGLHLALAALLALLGLTFITDPCGGGGDLCLGGAVGLLALGVAGVGLVGIVVWSFGRRASPLLVWDALVLVPAGYTVLASSGYLPTMAGLSALLIASLGLVGVVMAGRAVAPHRVERLLAIAALVGVAVLIGPGGVAILLPGLFGLGAGWALGRGAPLAQA